jgi:anti-sigma-K factor RskA
MPPPPVDDHTEEFEQLAGLAALGVLEGDDHARFEAHAAHCERCRLMVQLDREALALAAPEMEPSPDFKARLMQRAAVELATSEALAREPAKIIPFWRRAPWASAIAALLVVGIVIAGAFSYQNQIVASYTLSGTLGGSTVVNVRRSGATELDMNGVQNPPPGYIYEAWIIPPNGQPVAAGTMQSGDATVPLAQLPDGAIVAVTQERSRVDAPTSPPIMAVVVQS